MGRLHAGAAGVAGLCVFGGGDDLEGGLEVDADDEGAVVRLQRDVLVGLGDTPCGRASSIGGEGGGLRRLGIDTELLIDERRDERTVGVGGLLATGLHGIVDDVLASHDVGGAVDILDAINNLHNVSLQEALPVASIGEEDLPGVVAEVGHLGGGAIGTDTDDVEAGTVADGDNQRNGGAEAGTRGLHADDEDVSLQLVAHTDRLKNRLGGLEDRDGDGIGGVAGDLGAVRQREGGLDTGELLVVGIVDNGLALLGIFLGDLADRLLSQFDVHLERQLVVEVDVHGVLRVVLVGTRGDGQLALGGRTLEDGLGDIAVGDTAVGDVAGGVDVDDQRAGLVEDDGRHGGLAVMGFVTGCHGAQQCCGT